MKLGLIGNDTSHVEIFSRILHDQTHPFYIQEVTIRGFIEAFSKDLPISADRAAGYKAGLLALGIEQFDEPSALAKKVDGWLICTVHGGNHEDWLSKLVPYKKPIFIDKPLTLSVASAKRMVALANQYDTPIFSASSLRFSEAITPYRGQTISKLMVYGPLPLQEAMPGYYWYGIHSLEWVEALLPYELCSVTVHKTHSGELLTLYFENGAHAVIDFDYAWHDKFGGILFTEDQRVDVRLWETEVPYYVSLMNEIIRFVETKQAPISFERMVKIMAWVEQINACRAATFTKNEIVE